MGLFDSGSFKKNIYHTVNLSLEYTPEPIKKMVLAGVAKVPCERRLPTYLMIEPTNACNIHCPLCPVGANVMKRKRGFMDVDKFKGLIDEVSAFVKEIVMNFAGETMMHPRIGEMIAYAEGKGIEVTIGTNGTFEKTEELLDAAPTEILYAIDGLTQETYEEYRRGANLAQVKENLRKLTDGKRKRGQKKPKIVVQFVVMKHNEHEVPGVMELAREYGADEVSYTPVVVNDFFEDQKNSLLSRYIPKTSVYQQYKRAQGRLMQRKPSLCVWVFQSVVLYNGDVSICCFDFDGTIRIGNAFEPGGFLKVWKSDEYRRYREKIIRRELDLCQHCDYSFIKPVRIKVE
jgi:MoaA/NifB/PqqE/SkfB family radical SAM enzyme